MRSINIDGRADSTKDIYIETVDESVATMSHIKRHVQIKIQLRGI